MKRILLTLVLGASQVSFAQGADIAPASQPTLTTDLIFPPKSERTELSLRSGLLGRSMEDRYVNSKYAGGTIDLVGGHRISQTLAARLDVGFILSAGSYSNLYGTEGSAPNAVYVNEAALTYKPLDFLSLEAGVILTQFSTMPSNLESLGFPSLRQTASFGGDKLKTQIYAVQAIPTSDTAAVQSNQSGITTTLLVYGAGFTNNPEDLKGWTLSGSVSRFQFENLNASAATDSQTLGNSVDAAGGPQARFRHEFAGNEVGGEIAFRMDRGLKLMTSGAYLRNERAPEGKNKGYLYTAGFEQPMGRREVSASFGYFYNEEDTLPASYTSTGKGSNNRFGQVARLGVSDTQEEVTGYLQYTRANEIVNKPYTADRDIIVFGLEIAYDIL